MTKQITVTFDETLFSKCRDNPVLQALVACKRLREGGIPMQGPDVTIMGMPEGDVTWTTKTKGGVKHWTVTYTKPATTPAKPAPDNEEDY